MGNPGLGKLNVALHVRRADSCMNFPPSAYKTKPSPLTELGQVSGRRFCYATSVYIEQLQKISEKYELPLTVYLATDDSHSLLDDIRSKHRDFYDATTWSYLNYSRSNFKYKGFIES